MSGRVVSDIQTRAEGESLYIWYNTDANVVNDLWNSLVLWIFWQSNFENTSYITRENQSYSLCKSTKICIAYTDAFMLMISFVFSSWIINEFHNIVQKGWIIKSHGCFRCDSHSVYKFKTTDFHVLCTSLPFEAVTSIEIINNTREGIEAKLWERANGGGGEFRSQMYATQQVGFTWNHKILKPKLQA